ncbi:GNAT family N-acetyltransferase [Methanosarcina sp. Mfa9]|uniref:GNAT family N-acetyltransferase n=1 Tax=Methanosarcina sp. Mfa9 TaxID=3439063 RepID=UPI003F82C846
MIIKHLEKEMVLKNLDDLIKIDREIPDDPWKIDNFLIDLDRKWEFSLVALENSHIIGFLICSLKNNQIHIHRIAVLAEYQNKKVGSALISSLFDECYEHNIKRITLKVKNVNSGGHKFYKKYGFKIIGVENSRYICTKEFG